MRSRKPLLALCLCAAALFSACDSSSGNPASSQNGDPNTNPDPEGKANGVLKVGGRSLAVEVAGIYDDTSMTLTANSQLDDADTGWTLLLPTLPAQGDHPISAPEIQLNGTYSSADSSQSCIYTAKSGSITIDAWSTTQYGSYEGAKMSGHASLTLGPWALSSGCSEVSVELTFTDASAAKLGDVTQ